MYHTVKAIVITFESKRRNSSFKKQKTNSSQSTNSPVRNILSLQRTIGNQAVRRLLNLGVMQEANQRRSSNFAKTECDIKVHPDDFNYFLLRKSFRVVGTGKPKIVVLKPELKKGHPCLYEANMEHERQHIRNSAKICQDFKKCIDEHSSKFIGEPKISYEDFVNCHNKHHGGLMKDCIADEKSAYEEGIKKANTLIKKFECAKEKANLKQNIEYWKKIKDNAPNCKKPRK